MATVNLGQVRDKITSISRTSGTGAAGTTDTYTVYTECSPGGAGTFTVYNGANGVDGKRVQRHDITIGGYTISIMCVSGPGHAESIYDIWYLLRYFAISQPKLSADDGKDVQWIVDFAYNTGGTPQTMTLNYFKGSNTLQTITLNSNMSATDSVVDL